MPFRGTIFQKKLFALQFTYLKWASNINNQNLKNLNSSFLQNSCTIIFAIFSSISKLHNSAYTKHETHSSVKIVLIGWTWIISPKKICSLGQYNYWVFPMIAHIHNKLLKKRADLQWAKNGKIGKKIWKYKINIYFILCCRTFWGQVELCQIFFWLGFCFQGKQLYISFCILAHFRMWCPMFCKSHKC